MNCKTVNLSESKANFIVNPVDTAGFNGSKTNRFVAENYPHVERECLKYIRHNKKNGRDILGTAQFVARDPWALILCDPIKNDFIDAYDRDYQYIVNLFSFAARNRPADGSGYGPADSFGLHSPSRACALPLDVDENGFSLEMVRQGLSQVKDKASRLGGTVAVPKVFANCRGKNIVEEVFKGSNVKVEIF